jgi:serine/threonine protein kinase
MTTVPPTPTSLEVGIIRSALEADYEVLEELGRGGMAIVYRAKDRAIDREVAIKVLPFSLTFDGDFVERFQHEAQTAGQLEHPNIVPIYRVGRAGQVIFFVMKFLRGQSLAVALREREKLDPPEVRRIILDVASALGYASKSGVVHRDIKPDNILFDGEGRCVVTDFGIAKRSGTHLTAQGTSMGTPRYMSPEHAQGHKLDGRSDIYSLGIVAYQCLVGAIPFDGEDPFAVLYKHINTPLPSPQFKSDEERTLFAVIQRMLAKKPEDRFQDADEVISALGGQVSQPVLIGPTLTATVATRHRRITPTEIIITPLGTRIWSTMPRRWRYLSTAAALALLGGGGYAMYKLRPVSVPAPPPQSIPTVQLTPITTPPPPVVTAPTPRPPEPFSRCARVDAATALRRDSLMLLVDSVKNQTQGSTLTVNYDVCGLQKGAAYTTDIVVRRTSQSRLKRIVGGTVRPVSGRFVDVASSHRSRRRRTINISGLPPGPYALDVVIVDSKDRRRERNQQFEIEQK